MKDLFSNSGSYVPSFFLMKIDSEHFGNEMSDRETSLFVHEYVHFLQSITTVKGLERLTSDFWMLRRMVEYVKEQGKLNVSVLFNKDVLNEITKNNERIDTIAWGESCPKSIAKKIQLKNVSVDTKTFDIDGVRYMDTVTFTCIDAEGEEGVFTFGTRDLYEGMAYLIEQLITKDYEHSPDCPYSTAKMVAEYYYPELAKDPKNIIALCDNALMFTNPGVEYIRMIQFMKEVSFLPQSPDEIYTFIELNWEVYGIDSSATTLDAFISKVSEAREILHGCLSNDTYFDSYHQWVDFIFDFAISLRVYDPLFWIRIVDNGYVNENMYFKTLLNSIGTPIVEIKKNKCFSMNIMDDRIDTYCLSYFRVFYQIYLLLSEGTLMCNLLPWCSDSRCGTKPDKCCWNEPWNHCEQKDLCPFVAIWNHWGLNGIQIQRR